MDGTALALAALGASVVVTGADVAAGAGVVALGELGTDVAGTVVVNPAVVVGVALVGVALVGVAVVEAGAVEVGGTVALVADVVADSEVDELDALAEVDVSDVEVVAGAVVVVALDDVVGDVDSGTLGVLAGATAGTSAADDGGTV